MTATNPTPCDGRNCWYRDRCPFHISDQGRDSEACQSWTEAQARKDYESTGGYGAYVEANPQLFEI